MKSSIKTISIIYVLSLASFATANESLPIPDYNFYKVKFGVSQPSDLEGNSGLNSSDATHLLGASVGRKLEDRFAAELEYTYRGKSKFKYSAPEKLSTTSSNWEAESHTFMVNLSADLTSDDKIRPYLKGGIGLSRNKAYDYISSHPLYVNTYSGKTTSSFAYQAGAGINFVINSKISTELEYMFVNRGKIETKENYVEVTNIKTQTIPSNPRTGTLKEHTITVGIKIKF